MAKKNPYAHFFFLLGFLGWRDQEKTILLSFSNQRTDSIRGLTKDEFKALTVCLEQEKNKLKPKHDRKLKIVYALMGELGYTYTDRKGASRLDYKKFDQFLLQYGVYKKKLYSYNLKELDELIFQLRARNEKN
ncbi:hypothetical protein [Flammeovirga sp. SJP92]|uniref:hypothetical protein n=1 Tax=Flammeovirga sp. SJP92 TaxID=1775430 RepID=UPI00078809E4|nr:hypothetical protein [Flammeovirga sp. SJP92]KXX70618.1 hypothetical protein AVL50_07290 [Flammeovirga sp. SJP92]